LVVAGAFQFSSAAMAVGDFIIQVTDTSLTLACQSNKKKSMNRRTAQREHTRERIIQAAGRAFSEFGFRAASTRDIAARARANQGLITYHFRSKGALWKAAADRIFGRLKGSFDRPLGAQASEDARALARNAIRQYVRFAAAHPELFRLMVEEGKNRDARMRWLVDTHLKPLYAAFERLVLQYNPQVGRALLPHAYYALAGAASLIFAVAPECRRLTGLDPAQPQTVEAHAEFVARLLVP
jgi:TetR/AcrR family transcriptional regulator